MPPATQSLYRYYDRQNPDQCLVPTPEEIDASADLTGILFRRLSELKPLPWLPWLDSAIQALPESVRNATLPRPHFLERRLTKKLPLESLQKLDMIDCQKDHELIRKVIKQIFSIAYFHRLILPVREVFFVALGEPLPENYRPNIDVCCHTRETFIAEASKVSYLVVKILHKLLKEDNDDLVKIPDLTAPLHEWPIFSSAAEALLSLADRDRNSIRIAFGPQVLMPDLQGILHHLDKEECIILLQGSHYESQAERNEVCQQVLNLIKTTKCSSFLHIFLLTQKAEVYTLQDLSPKIQDHEIDFSPLALDKGYYLSSPNVFAATYRLRQSKVSPEFPAFSSSPAKEAEHNIINLYIVGGKEKKVSEHYRHSKRYNRASLKAKATLSINHQQSLSQAKEVTQTEAVSESLAVSQSQAIHQQASLSQSLSRRHGGFSLPAFNISFKYFCELLIKKAELHLNSLHKIEMRAQYFDEMVLTKYFREHFSSRLFFERILTDKKFRVETAATLFGLIVLDTQGQETLLSLPNYSIDSIDKDLEFQVLYKIEGLDDGPDPNRDRIEVHYSPFGGRCLKEFHREYVAELHLPPLLLSQYAAHRSHLQYRVLLRDEALVSLESAQQTSLIADASLLISLFKTKDATWHSENIATLEHAFFRLMAFHFKDKPEYLRLLERFFGVFEEHEVDNLKILIQIMISGYRNRMEYFLKYLTLIESRDFLLYFYKLYFKYAKTVSSVDDLLDNIKPHYLYSVNPFIQILSNKSTFSGLNRRLFEKFSCSMLIDGAKYNRDPDSLKCLIDFWQNLSTLLLAYTQHQEAEAQSLLECFVANLTTEDGLSLAPVRLSLSSLWTFIQWAASTSTNLREQFQAIKHLSLRYTDVLYAIKHNGFLRVSAEMELYKQAINPVTRRYSVSLEELHQALIHDKKSSLKRTVFRYLGGVRFCEDLQYYRHLFNWLDKESPDSRAYFIKERAIAYYVSLTTGSEPKSRPKQEEFLNDFLSFYQSHFETCDRVLVETIVSGLFEASFLEQTDANKGVTTLWALWQKPGHVLPFAANKIPNVLSQKFELKQSKRFLLNNSHALLNCASMLDQERYAYALIKTWLPKAAKANYESAVTLLLRSIYPQLNMPLFMKDLVKIISFVETYISLVQRGAHDKLFVALKRSFIALKLSKDIDKALALFDIIATALSLDSLSKKNQNLCAEFLKLLNRESIVTHKPLLTAILNFYLKKTGDKASLPLLFQLSDALMPLGIARASLLLDRLLNKMYRHEIYQFFEAHPRLSLKQLETLLDLFETFENDLDLLPLLEKSLLEYPETDFMALKNNLDSPEQVVLATVFCKSSEPILSHLSRLKAMPKDCLEQLAQLQQCFNLNSSQLQELLDSPSILEAIADFERSKQTSNLERYHYNRQEVAEKIAGIRYKSPKGSLALDAKTQDQLLQDYDQLMSYMIQKPLIYNQGKLWTINELSKLQCRALLKALIPYKHDHEHQLLLLALCCEVMYRTSNKFPRHIQVLTLLNGLRQKRSIIHEVRTGEGKSIIAALLSILKYDGILSIDIGTENDHLAQEGLTTFRPLYAYLDIPCAKNIIEANSPYQSYVAAGINYSTPSGLALFEKRMKLLKKRLPSKRLLICDEIDSFLTSTLQFRLAAASLNSLMLDTNAWKAVYKTLLAFSKEKDLFIDNTCDDHEDVSNFKQYFKLKHGDKNLGSFIDNVPNKKIDTLLESVQIADILEQGEDYLIVEKKGSKIRYAAPILDSNHRPDPAVNYDAGIQQLLMTKYELPFEPECETIIVVSPKNFFDGYRRHGGEIIGLTATGGGAPELQEFFDDHELIVYAYPSFFPEGVRDDLGLVPAWGRQAHLEQIHQSILQHKVQYAASKPILILTSSPEFSEGLNKYLEERSDWILQTYSGYAKEGQFESGVVKQGGEDNVITIANGSLGRGADFRPKHALGLFVLDTRHQVTADELEQGFGRGGRNGKTGQQASVIDVSSFAEKGSTLEAINAAFKDEQEKLSLSRQKLRLQGRVLEKIRHCLVEDLLDLRSRADKILSRQFGYGGALVSEPVLFKTLSDFNLQAEAQHQALLGQGGRIEGAALDEFLKTMLGAYQTILDSWLKNDQIINFRPIEPLIQLDQLEPLDALHPMTLAQLALMSQLFALVWRHFGHQTMQATYGFIDQQIDCLEPYFKGEWSLQKTVAQSLLAHDSSNLFTITEGIEGVKQEIPKMIGLAKATPYIGHLFPGESIGQFLTNYLETSQTQIKEQRWDDLALPSIEFQSINAWFSRITTAVSVTSNALKLTALVGSISGGPITFFINNYALPTFVNWLTPIISAKCKNASSTYLQTIVGISQATGDLCLLLESLSLLSNPHLRMGELLDKFAPFFKNKAVEKLLILLLEVYEQAALIPYVQLIPEYLTSLEPYRDRSIHELKPDLLLVAWAKLSQLDDIKKAFEDTQFETLIARLNGSAEILPHLSQLNFQAFFGLVKVASHPEFCTFLQGLPPKANFAQLLLWLRTPTEALPPELQGAFQALRTYQSDREGIGANSRLALLHLRSQFDLSPEALKHRLEEKRSPPAAQPDANFKDEGMSNCLRYSAIAVGLSLVITYNVLFFSTNALLISACLLALLANTVFPKRSSEEGLKPIVLDARDKPSPLTGYQSFSLFRTALPELKKTLGYKTINTSPSQSG